MPLIASTNSDAPHPKRRKASTAQALRQLTDGTPFARRQAAMDLHGQEQAIDPLIARLDCEEDGAVREAILLSLTASGSDAVVEAMIDLLRSEDAARRNEGVTALQGMSEQLLNKIPELLADPDPDMRIMTIDVLRLLPDANAPVWLRQLLDTETHHNVIGNAIDRMADVGGPDDLPCLRAVRERFSDVPYISFATDMVIQRIETLAREGSG